MGRVTVRYYAAAAEAAGCKEEAVDGDDLGTLLDRLADARDARFRKVLEASNVFVDGVKTTRRDLPLDDADLVEILPPYAGG